MLKIIANKTELDLGALKGITQRKNPGIFDLDSTDGSYNVPFTIDANEINNKAFGFPYKMGNPDVSIREVPGELWHSVIKISEGVIKASKFSKKKINCSFYIDNGTLYKDFNQKKLNENYFGGEKPLSIKSSYDYTLDDFVLYMVKNGSYFNDSFEEGDIFNFANNQNYYSAGTFRWESGYPSAITPFPLLWRSLNYLFSNKGFQYLDNFFSQGDYRRINIFNTVNALVSTTYESEGKEYTRNKLPATYNLANFMPRIPTGDFIRAIQNFFNVKFYVRDYKVQVLDRLEVINSTDYDDLSDKLIGDYTRELTGFEPSGIAYSIQPDANDENTSGIESVPEGFIYDETVDEQGYPPDEWPIFPSPVNPTFPYKIVLCHNDNDYNRYYQYKNAKEMGNPDAHWWSWYPLEAYTQSLRIQAMLDHQRGLFLGDRQFEINAALSSVPLHLRDTEVEVHDFYKPKVKQKGNSYQHFKFNEFSLRLMMYCGVQTDVEGEEMPAASDSFGNISINPFWSYFKRWKDYIDWFKKAQKERYECELDLSASEIKNFDFSRKKLINGHKFFITNMEPQYTRKTINPVKCKMIKAEP